MIKVYIFNATPETYQSYRVIKYTLQPRHKIRIKHKHNITLNIHVGEFILADLSSRLFCVYKIDNNIVIFKIVTYFVYSNDRYN